MIGKPWTDLKRFVGNPNARQGDIPSIAAPNDAAGRLFVAADGADISCVVWVRLRHDGRWYALGDQVDVRRDAFAELCDIPAGSEATLEILYETQLVPNARLEVGLMGGMPWKR